jgi:hypothetical protein
MAQKEEESLIHEIKEIKDMYLRWGERFLLNFHGKTYLESGHLEEQVGDGRITLS